MIKNFVSILLASIFRKGFDFKGRSTKKEYFIFTIFEFLVFTPLFILERKYGKTDLLTIILLICLIIYIIPYTALTIRRLHDFNLKGWWYLLSLIFSPIIFLVFCFIKGDKEKNKYGPPPEY